VWVKHRSVGFVAFEADAATTGLPQAASSAVFVNAVSFSFALIHGFSISIATLLRLRNSTIFRCRLGPMEAQWKIGRLPRQLKKVQCSSKVEDKLAA